jgi:hypothetical protein
MKMKPIYFLLIAAAVGANALASNHSVLTPQSVKDDTRRIGAKAVVQQLYSSNRWETVLKKIETGDDAWLAVVQDLAEGTDAGTSEDLQVTLARALPKNPGAVLRLTGTESFLSLDDVCAAPFIEPEHAFLMRYLTETRRSLASLNDTAVESKRLKCLSQIEQQLTTLKHRHE